MKLYDVIEYRQFAIMDAEHGCFHFDVTREEDEYESVEFEREISFSALKNEREYVYNLINELDGEEAANIETVYKYAAVLDTGEKVDIYVPDVWN